MSGHGQRNILWYFLFDGFLDSIVDSKCGHSANIARSAEEEKNKN